MIYVQQAGCGSCPQSQALELDMQDPQYRTIVGPIDASKFVDCVCRVALSSEKLQAYFAAGYPMCEALYNHTISDEQIVVLAKTPVWLLHAVTDAIISPEETAVPTYGTPT